MDNSIRFAILAVMKILPIRTRRLLPPQDDLFDVLSNSLAGALLTPQEEDILFITSKVASIHQGRCVPIKEVEDKDALIIKEANAVLKSKCQSGILVGIEHAMVNPFAGIDESNANGHYILLPKEPNKFAQKVRKYIIDRFNISKFGVIVVDSSFLPMRSGSVGISIGFAGLEPLRRYVGMQDIFGKELKMSSANIVDSLSALAVMYMGEGSEQTPFVLMQGVEGVEFTDKDKSTELTDLEFGDSFCAFLELFTWKKK